MLTAREKPLSTELRERGQVTIPKKLRERYHLSEGSELVIIPVGEALLLAPRPLPLEEARKKLIKIMKDSGLTVEDLLTGIKEERERLVSKKYGKHNS